MLPQPLLRKRSMQLGGLIVVAVLFLLFGFGSTSASANLVVPPWDKVVHFAVFSVFAIGLRIWLADLRWPWILLLAAGIGVVDELHQLFVPGRYAEIDDALADAFGAAVGLLVWYGSKSRLLRMIERST